MILKRKTFSTALNPDELFGRLKELEQRNKAFRVIRSRGGNIKITCNTMAPKGLPVVVELSFNQSQGHAVYAIEKVYFGLIVTMVIVWLVIGLFLFLAYERFIIPREAVRHFQWFYPFVGVFFVIMCVGLVWNNLIEAENELHSLLSQ